jgi:biotin transporter BioY
MAKVWLAFNGFDVLVTFFALRLGAIEANPIIDGLTSALGEPAGYSLKFLFAVLVAATIYRTGRTVLFKWLNAGMGLIVIFNIAVVSFCLLNS